MGPLYSADLEPRSRSDLDLDSKNRYFERVLAVRRAVITARVGQGVGRELA